MRDGVGAQPPGSGTLGMSLSVDVAGRGVDLAHRDSRLAVGLLPDCTMVVVLTRFTGLGSPAETFPWGPTVPEMAAFMKALGCVRAMLLDGGISGQLAVRMADGKVREWTSRRAVPLGLVVTLRRP